MRRRSRGFWLSEVLTALWLITFVGAGLLGIFVYLTKTTKLANERAAADLLADRLLERAVRMGPPDWGLEAGQLRQQVVTDVGHEGKQLSFNLSPQELEHHRLGKLFLLEVTVSWAADPGLVSGVERGRGELMRDRQVYIEDISNDPDEEEPVEGG